MTNFSTGQRGWISTALLARFTADETDAHRLCTAEDGWVERFGEDVLISYTSEPARDGLLAGLAEWSAAAGFQARRVFGKLLPRQNADRVAPVLLAGEPDLPLTTVVREHGARYGLDFVAGYSAGLYIDQRRNRLFLRSRPPKRLLNTFAYTASFSVIAALEGATTTSLDLSKKSLARGQENFRLNGLDPVAHSFIADDVLEVLPRLSRRGEKYDGIILDPPTFSRGEKGRRFQVEHDFEALLSAALELAAPNASLLLSTNCAKLTRPALETIARFCLKLARRQGSFHAEPDLPDIPGDAAARTVWLLLR